MPNITNLNEKLKKFWSGHDFERTHRQMARCTDMTDGQTDHYRAPIVENQNLKTLLHIYIYYLTILHRNEMHKLKTERAVDITHRNWQFSDRHWTPIENQTCNCASTYMTYSMWQYSIENKMHKLKSEKRSLPQMQKLTI